VSGSLFVYQLLRLCWGYFPPCVLSASICLYVFFCLFASSFVCLFVCLFVRWLSCSFARLLVCLFVWLVGCFVGWLVGWVCSRACVCVSCVCFVS